VTVGGVCCKELKAEERRLIDPDVVRDVWGIFFFVFVVVGFSFVLRSVCSLVERGWVTGCLVWVCTHCAAMMMLSEKSWLPDQAWPPHQRSSGSAWQVVSRYQWSSVGHQGLSSRAQDSSSMLLKVFWCRPVATIAVLIARPLVFSEDSRLNVNQSKIVKELF
jgi:hypothetical protein